MFYDFKNRHYNYFPTIADSYIQLHDNYRFLRPRGPLASSVTTNGQFSAKNTLISNCGTLLTGYYLCVVRRASVPGSSFSQRLLLPRKTSVFSYQFHLRQKSFMNHIKKRYRIVCILYLLMYIRYYLCLLVLKPVFQLKHRTECFPFTKIILPDSKSVHTLLPALPKEADIQECKDTIGWTGAACTSSTVLS